MHFPKLIDGKCQGFNHQFKVELFLVAEIVLQEGPFGKEAVVASLAKQPFIIQQ